MQECCLRGFQWDGEPVGAEADINGQKCYVTGSNPDVAIIVIHDLFGWTFKNLRLLADSYAADIGATVYLPDFFGGEVVSTSLILAGAFDQLDLPAFLTRNSKEIRFPEMARLATHLRTTLSFSKIGAIGFCYGGWAVFQLGAKTHSPPLVDCISTAHPSLLTKEEMDGVGVPAQILAPEFDSMFTQELKEYAATQIALKTGVPVDYQYFPGVEHAFAVRGNLENEKEVKGMERARRAAVGWCREWLVEQK